MDTEASGYAVHLFNLANALHTAKHNRSVDMAVPYYWDTVENASIREEYISNEVIYGAGNIISNVLDYRLWLRTMIDEMGPISKAQHTGLSTQSSASPGLLLNSMTVQTLVHSCMPLAGSFRSIAGRQ